MENILKNKWFAITITLIIGITIGLLLIRPLLKIIEKKAVKKKLLYWARLFNTINKVSFIFGAVLLLNFLEFYPFFDLSIQGTFKNILKILNAIIITFLVAEILVFIYDKYSNKRSENKASTLFHIIIRILVYFAGIITISSILNYDIKALLTALGVGGLAVALALQDTLGNLFAGMQILASKQLKPGDYIKVEDSVEGYVLDINWRNTTIKTLLENIIIIPNSKISTTITTNYFTLQKNLYFKINVGVHYDSDLEFVEKVTLEVAKEVLSQYPNVPKDFTPRVRFFEFADSSINFKVWMATDLYENKFVIQHHFIKSLQARFNKEGIIIPFPIRTVHIQS